MTIGQQHEFLNPLAVSNLQQCQHAADEEPLLKALLWMLKLWVQKDTHRGLHEGRGDKIELQHSQRGQHLVDALENVIVQVPGLVQLGFSPALLVLLAPLERFPQLMPKVLPQHHSSCQGHWRALWHAVTAVKV